MLGLGRVVAASAEEELTAFSAGLVTELKKIAELAKESKLIDYMEPHGY